MNRLKWFFMSGKNKLLYEIEHAKENREFITLPNNIKLDFTMPYNKKARLTYRDNGEAYLYYGLDALWKKCERYFLIKNAIDKLAYYEDNDLECTEEYDIYK